MGTGSGAGMQRVTDVVMTKNGELHVMHERDRLPAARTVYALRAGKWVGRTGAVSVVEAVPQKEPRLEVSVRQSMNDPAGVYASDGKHELALLEPDPALEGVWRSRMEDFQWQEPNGTKGAGGLWLPRNYTRGKPIPVVIQVQAFNPDTFLPDGPYAHSDAAQTLVAHGFAVVQIGMDMDAPMGRPVSEGPEFVSRIDAIVDTLAAQGDRPESCRTHRIFAGRLPHLLCDHASRSHPDGRGRMRRLIYR